MEFAQGAHNFFRLAHVGKGGEADDIDEQHSDVLRAHLLQWFVVLGQFLHHVWREVAREIAALAFYCGMADQEIIATAHRDCECHRDNHEHNDLLDSRAEHDRVGRDQLEQPLIAAYRRCDAVAQIVNVRQLADQIRGTKQAWIICRTGMLLVLRYGKTRVLDIGLDFSRVDVGQAHFAEALADKELRSRDMIGVKDASVAPADMGARSPFSLQT